MQIGGSALPSLHEAVTGFWTWWRDELSGLVPDRLRRLFAPGQPKTILVRQEDGFVVLNGPSRSGRATGAGAGSSLAWPEALSRLVLSAKRNGEAEIGIRLPLDGCFLRTVELPAAARKDLRRILDFDLERATPFKHKDVYAAYMVEGEATAKGKLRIRQLVTKRAAVDPLIADIQAAGLGVAFVDCWTDSPATRLPINFVEPREDGSGATSRLLRPVWVLVALVALLTISAFLLTLSAYESALAQLQAQAAQARAQAAAVRSVEERSDAAVADLARLQGLKLKRIPAIEVLEEVSRILPDSAWLSELRIEGDSLDITGLASSAAGLPTLFERSAILADASLAAPVTLDQREDKERFTLRVHVKNPDARQAPAGGKED